MEQDKSTGSRSVQSLPDIAASLFSLILSLRTSHSYGQEGELRARIAQYLDRIDKQGLEAGIAREDIESAKYPLVAFIDETILNSEWIGVEGWRARPLQLDLFGETIAGEKFFERLDRIRQQGEVKADLLEIYYLCLVLGFEGKYKIAGPERLRALVDEVRRDLRVERSRRERAPISPNGRRRVKSRGGADDDFPLLKVTAWSAGGLALLFLVLYFVIGHAAGSALQKLNALNAG